MAQTRFSRSRPRPRRQPEHWSQDLKTGPRDLAPAPGHLGNGNGNGTNGDGMAACPVTQVRGLSSATGSASNGDLNGSTIHTGNSALETADQTAGQLQGEPVNPAKPKVDDEWRRWLAECITLDCERSDYYGAMMAAGFDPDEANTEIDLALNSPYVRGAEVLRNRLKKRDWLLSAYRKINRINPESFVIPRRHKLSRGQFLNEYYSTNRPVIITGMMDDWPALTKWNLEFFESQFADREVEVQFGRNSAADYEIHKHKHVKKLRMGEFIDLIRNSGKTNDFYLTAANTSNNKAVFPELWNDFTQIPEYLDPNGSHNGFFWMGPPGTITPFHHDLTNNFMAQVVGRKKVKIAPSWDLPLMRNEIHVFCHVDGQTTPAQVNPDINEPQIFECILNPGELLFLPIGCLHYVEGIDMSITVSFQNFVFRNDFGANYTTFYRV